MELTLSEGKETRGNKINGGGHNGAAAKRNNDKEVLRERNCTSEDFYYLPPNFKTSEAATGCLQNMPSRHFSRSAELFLYHAHRLELHFSRRTA